MSEIPEKCVNDPEFREFLNQEFNHTATCATMEELAEFAFGGIEETIEAFKKNKKS